MVSTDGVFACKCVCVRALVQLSVYGRVIKNSPGLLLTRASQLGLQTFQLTGLGSSYSSSFQPEARCLNLIGDSLSRCGRHLNSQLSPYVSTFSVGMKPRIDGRFQVKPGGSPCESRTSRIIVGFVSLTRKKRREGPSFPREISFNFTIISSVHLEAYLI